MEHMNERELLSAAMQGSQIAYRELISLHQSTVYRFAWALIGEEHAQAVTEHAFVAAWRQLGTLLGKGRSSFQERLLQLVCAECAPLAKRRRRHRGNLPAAQDEDALNFPFPPMRYDPRSNMEHIALQSDIDEAIRALPFSLRQIFLLHEIGSLADTQIADITGTGAQEVHSALLRAQGLVRRQILLGGGFFPLDGAAGKSSKNAPQYRACRSYLPTLAAAADDLCTNAEKQILSSHFAKCPGCQGYYQSLRAIHHGIAVMKHEAPSDMASRIIHRIQQEDDPDGNAEDLPARRRLPAAFGRLLIVALCLGLIFLAYSNGIAERFGLPGAPDRQTQQSQQTPPAPDDPGTQETEPPQPPEQPEDDTPPSAEEPVPEPETPETPAPDPQEPETDPVWLPDGEVYAAVYIVDSSGAQIVGAYAPVAFSAQWSDGSNADYHAVPADQSALLLSALEEAAVSCTPYTQNSGALDSSAATALYIVLS